MADIKQAAKWMQEGKKVARSCWSIDLRSDDYRRPWLCFRQNDPRVMTVSRGGNNWSGPDFIIDDLLADDWEIVGLPKDIGKPLEK